MRKKWIGLAITALLVVGLFLLKTERLFWSHETAVTNTITSLLARNQQQLPQEKVDLSMLHVQHINLHSVIEWEVRNIELANTVPLSQAFLDDDPIYKLKADIHVTYASGEQAILSWESWRYGLVLGSRVISLGNGPPGYIIPQ